MTHIRIASRMQDEDLTETKLYLPITHSISVKNALGINTAHFHARVSAFAPPQTVMHDACWTSRTGQKVRKRSEESRSTNFRWTKILLWSCQYAYAAAQGFEGNNQDSTKTLPSLGKEKSGYTTYCGTKEMIETTNNVLRSIEHWCLQRQKLMLSIEVCGGDWKNLNNGRRIAAKVVAASSTPRGCSSLDLTSFAYEKRKLIRHTGRALGRESTIRSNVRARNLHDHAHISAAEYVLEQKCSVMVSNVPYQTITDKAISFNLSNYPASLWNFSYAWPTRTRSDFTSTRNNLQLHESIKHRNEFSGGFRHVRRNIRSFCYHTNLHKNMCDEEMGSRRLQVS